MSSYVYQVMDKTGKRNRGVMTADNIRDVSNKLRTDGFYVLRVDELAKKIGKAGEAKGFTLGNRVKLKEKLFLTKQLQIMLKAGLNLIACLNNLANQTRNRYLHGVINQIRADVESGDPLSAAFAKHAKIFTAIYINMIEAGEASGKLDLSFLRLSEYLQREYDLRKKVVGAMTYPAVIVSVAVIVVIILVAVVLPMFTQIFADSGAQLPLNTRMLIAFSGLVRKYWFLLPVLPLGLFFGYKKVKSTQRGAAAVDRFLLGVPVIGDLLLKLAVARFSKTFSTLLDSGVPILQSLEIVQRSVGNAVLAEEIKTAIFSVTRGAGLAQPLAASNLFPPMVSQMVAVGEDTGDLAHMLNEVAEYYDKEVGYAVESLTAMIEPFVIVCLGGVVAFIVSSIMLPLFDMSSGATLQ